MSNVEEWAGIEGLSNYLISNHGRVLDKRTNTIRTLSVTPGGSLAIGLDTDKKIRLTFQGKWLVWRAFQNEDVAPRSIRNIDGDKTNIVLWNLELRDS